MATKRHNLGEQIAKQLRKDKRSQAWLGEQVGVTRYAVGKWLVKDGNRISAENLQAICDVTHADKNEFFKLAIETWPIFKEEYEPYLKQTNQQTKNVNVEKPNPKIELPDLPDLKSKTCPIYFELKLGKEELIKDSNDRRERPIFEFPFLMWTERAEDWRKHFTETPAHTLLQQWSQEAGFHSIVGEPGGGKSTLLRSWAHKLVEMSTLNKQYLPLLVPLREIDETGVEGFFDKQGFDIKPYLEGNVEGVQPVWLFDGLDELPKKHKATWTKLIKAQKQHPVLLTCRTALWDSDHRVNFGEPHYLIGMYPKDQKTFLQTLADEWRDGERYEYGFEDANEAWVDELYNKLQSQLSLKQLAGSPLLLTLIARTNKPYNIDLPAKRVTFYQKAFKELLKQREDDEINAWTFIEPLSKLAYEVSKDELKAEFSESEFEKYISGLSKEQIKALKKSNILRFSDEGYCQWLHQTFQEWLFAEYLNENYGLLSAVQKYWGNPNYHEVLGLLWGLNNHIVQYKTAEYLIVEGRKQCRKFGHKSHSGLRTLFSLVNRCGEEPDQDLYELLWENTNVSFERQIAVAASDVPPEILLADLAKSDDYSVRIRVAQNPNSLPETLAMLAEDTEEYIRSTVASNVSSSYDTLAKLSTSKSSTDSIRWNVAENVNTPPAILTELAKDENDYVREKVAKNANTPPEALTELLKDKKDSIRMEVAKNRNSSPETLTNLTEDDNSYIRRSVAENTNTSFETLAMLASDNDAYVRRSVAQNANCPHNILIKLSKDKAPSVRWCVIKILNPLPRALIDVFNEAPYIRRSVAENINCPTGILSKLAWDEDKSVRYYVAINRNSSYETLNKLANDYTEYVRWGVALNTNTSVETLALLAKDNGVYVRIKVAENTSCSRVTLDELAQDEMLYVRGNVAENMNCSRVTLSELAKDSAEYVRRRVASNSNSSSEILAELAIDEDVDVRKNVAINDNTSSQTLVQLLDDASGSVWSNVVENSSICLEWF